VRVGARGAGEVGGGAVLERVEGWGGGGGAEKTREGGVWKEAREKHKRARRQGRQRTFAHSGTRMHDLVRPSIAEDA
jgi:hypothetical protein